MLKKLNFFLLLLIFTSFSDHTFSQYSSPESVTYDPVSKRYFISNTGSGKIVQRDQSGVVTDFVTVGGTLRGITILDSIIYACSSTSVKGYNLNTAAQVMNLTMGTSLNDITTDTNKFLYVSNFSNSAGLRTIFKINSLTSQFWEYAQVSRQPNGVYADHKRNRLLVASWGSSATVVSVSLTDSTNISTLVTTPYSNLDGMSLDRNDNVYLSSYSGGIVFRYDINFVTSPVTVSSGHSSHADIYVNRITDTLAVPNAGSNSVSFVLLSIPSSIQTVSSIAESFKLNQNYPNPFNPATTIKFSLKNTGYVSLKIFDIIGKEIKSLVSENLYAGVYSVKFDAGNLPSGVYFYELRSKDFSDVRKMTLVK